MAYHKTSLFSEREEQFLRQGMKVARAVRKLVALLVFPRPKPREWHQCPTCGQWHLKP